MVGSGPDPSVRLIPDLIKEETIAEDHHRLIIEEEMVVAHHPWKMNLVEPECHLLTIEIENETVVVGTVENATVIGMEPREVVVAKSKKEGPLAILMFQSNRPTMESNPTNETPTAKIVPVVEADPPNPAVGPLPTTTTRPKIGTTVDDEGVARNVVAVVRIDAVTVETTTMRNAVVVDIIEAVGSEIEIEETTTTIICIPTTIVITEPVERVGTVVPEAKLVVEVEVAAEIETETEMLDAETREGDPIVPVDPEEGQYVYVFWLQEIAFIAER